MCVTTTFVYNCAHKHLTRQSCDIRNELLCADLDNTRVRKYYECPACIEYQLNVEDDEEAMRRRERDREWVREMRKETEKEAESDGEGEREEKEGDEESGNRKRKDEIEEGDEDGKGKGKKAEKEKTQDHKGKAKAKAKAQSTSSNTMRSPMGKAKASTASSSQLPGSDNGIGIWLKDVKISNPDPDPNNVSSDNPPPSPRPSNLKLPRSRLHTRSGEAISARRSSRIAERDGEGDVVMSDVGSKEAEEEDVVEDAVIKPLIVVKLRSGKIPDLSPGDGAKKEADEKGEVSVGDDGDVKENAVFDGMKDGGF
ncbi:uncharacterized protein RCO7_10102 [Rhynchosporium graminicola]|uniref:Uncharacterized protein n=1 Tax=Rhynchosporium graminicola TaxID=2792576 RepID=A0A1E1K8Q0_9HELO|nr:uncharacterized protein RCO7_10102 [Rhynchosporium commune]